MKFLEQLFYHRYIHVFIIPFKRIPYHINLFTLMKHVELFAYISMYHHDNLPGTNQEINLFTLSYHLIN